MEMKVCMDKYARYDAQAGFSPMRPQEILTENPIGYIQNIVLLVSFCTQFT